jgi:hypothetical protein
MRDLLARTMMEACDEYFGLDLAEPNAFLDRTFANSALLFADPLGNLEWRRQTLAGAGYNRHVIDRAIDKVFDRLRSGKAVDDTVLARLVKMHVDLGGTLTTGEIRAITIGTVTGLVPTNTLGAAKMIEELQRRPEVFTDIEAIAKTWKAASDTDKEPHREALKKILWELARLSPGLQPGQWRWAPADTEIAGKPVPKNSVLMVATMSALRDGRHFTDQPNAYKPDRAWDPNEPRLMFGTGDHACVGTYLAMEQIAEVFLVLFSQPGIRWSDRPVGGLTYVGPFPRRLDMEFDPEVSPRQQDMISVQLPLKDLVALATVQQQLDGLGNPAAGPLKTALDETGLIHFASLTAFDAADPDKTDPPDPRLLIELNVDGDPDKALEVFARVAEPFVQGLLAHAKDGAGPFLDVLKRHRFDLHAHPVGVTGLKFFGTPEFPVTDIELQQQVASEARKALEAYYKRRDLQGRPTEALDFVRRWIRRKPSLSGFLTRPSRRRLAISEWTGEGTNVGFAQILLARATLYPSLLLSALVLAMSGATYKILVPDSIGAWAFIVGGGAATVALILAVADKDRFPGLLDAWAKFQRRSAYPAILIGGAALLAALLAAIYAAGAFSYEQIGDWLPSVAPPVQLALACIAGPAIVALAAWFALVLWRWRKAFQRPLALAGGIAALAWLVLYAPAVLFAFAGGVLTIALLAVLVVGTLALLLRRLEQSDRSTSVRPTSPRCASSPGAKTRRDMRRTTSSPSRR